MNKSGNFPDVVEWLRFVVAFMFVAGFVLLFISNWNSNIQVMNESVIPNISKQASASVNANVPNGLDYLFLFIFVVFVVFSVVAARLIPSSPKFIILAFFALLFLVVGSMFVANIWDGFYSNASIMTVFSGLTFLPFIMDKLVYFTLGYAFIVGVALLTKSEGGGVFS